MPSTFISTRPFTLCYAVNMATAYGVLLHVVGEGNSHVIGKIIIEIFPVKLFIFSLQIHFQASGEFSSSSCASS